MANMPDNVKKLYNNVTKLTRMMSLSNHQQAMSLSNDQQAIVDIMEGREMENRHNKQIIAIKKKLLCIVILYY